MTIHVGSDATAVHSTSESAVTATTFSVMSPVVLPSVSKTRVSSYTTVTPRPFWLTRNSWSAIMTVPLLGWTDVLAAAVIVMLAGPTKDTPETDSQSLLLITFQPTMLPVLTPTVNDSPAASNS